MIEQLFRPEVQEFLKKNAEAEVKALALQAQKYPDLPFRLILDQINARQKLRTKVPSWVANSQVVFPPELSLEQCSSEETARYKAGLIRGKSIVDITGGMGVDLFFLADRFEKVHYIEQNGALATLAAHNFKALNKSSILIHAKDGIEWLRETAETFDFIYIDPARRDQHQRKVSSLEDSTPNVIEHLPLLLQKGRQILIKTAPMLDITQSLLALKHVKEIHVVALNNDCKEVLYLLDPTFDAEPIIHTINLGSKPQSVSFRKTEEQCAPVSFSKPLLFIYEPNAALLKSGAYKLICQLFSVKKLAVHTHLYTSDELIIDFPGRCFELKAVLKVDKSAVHKSLSRTKANLSIRNFPMSVNDLRKKLALNEGGLDYLFACTLENGDKVVLHTQKAEL